MSDRFKRLSKERFSNPSTTPNATKISSRDLGIKFDAQNRQNGVSLSDFLTFFKATLPFFSTPFSFFFSFPSFGGWSGKSVAEPPPTNCAWSSGSAHQP